MRGLLVVLLVVAACDDQDSSGRPFTPIEQIATQLQAATCTHLVACHVMPDQATCVATNLYNGAGIYIEPETLQLVLTGKVRYDGGLVASCLADLAAQSCTLNGLDRRVSFQQCVLNVFHGSVATGGACSANAECISGACNCNSATACCTGTCLPGEAMPLTPLPIGAACPQSSGGFNACTPDAFCDPSSTICTVLEPAGANCISDNECGDGLKCTFSGTTSTSTCTAVPHLGQSCATIAICGDEGTYCDSQTQMCTAVKFRGASCATGGCSPALTCSQTRVCETYPATGASCIDQGRCNDYGTYCNDSQLCALPNPVGAACHTQADCTTQYCDGTTMKCAAVPTCP